MITVILGPDRWLARQELSRLMDQIDPDRFGTTVVEASTASTAEVIGAVSTMAMLTGERLTVVESAFRKTSGDGDTGKRKTATVDLEAVIAAVSASNRLILFDAQSATVPVRINKLLPADTERISCPPLRGNELVTWMQSMATTLGGAIDPEAARTLAQRRYPHGWQAAPRNPAFDDPPDMGQLALEVDKLVLFAGEQPVSREDVELLVLGENDDSPFVVLDAMLAGDARRYVAAIRNALAGGQDSSRLLATIQGQSELAVFPGADDVPRDAEAIGRDLGLSNPKRMLAINSALRHGHAAAVQDASKLLASDVAQKTGKHAKPVDSLFAAIPSDSGADSDS